MIYCLQTAGGDWGSSFRPFIVAFARAASFSFKQSRSHWEWLNETSASFATLVIKLFDAGDGPAAIHRALVKVPSIPSYVSLQLPPSFMVTALETVNVGVSASGADVLWISAGNANFSDSATAVATVFSALASSDGIVWTNAEKAGAVRLEAAAFAAACPPIVSSSAGCGNATGNVSCAELLSAG